MDCYLKRRLSAQDRKIQPQKSRGSSSQRDAPRCSAAAATLFGQWLGNLFETMRPKMQPVNQEEPLDDDIRREVDDDEDEEDVDTSCGFGPCRKLAFFSKYFANKNTFIIVYGVLGCIYGSTYAYSNATLSTIEKRFKIPSKVTGVISVGNDISSLFAAGLLGYYAGKGHRPRWMAVGIFCVALFCFITLLPHLIWGPGEDALSLTTEHGGLSDSSDFDVHLIMKRKTLCRAGFNDSLAGAECKNPHATEESGTAPAALLFLAQFVSGLGGSLYYTLGTSYMDDNIKKSKTPALVSVTYFMKMLGPAVGYSIGSFFLKTYISPSLTPTITNTDPRWLGAWWAGWAVLGVLLIILAFLIAMFPQTMPRTVIRRREARARGETVEQTASSEKASLSDMIETVKRLLKNKVYMCNTLAAIFYMFGFMPFWMYTPKYIEVQYRISAARASFFTGSVGLVFSAFGILISGFVITRFKPGARSLAFWNVIVSLIAVAATLIYPFLGCSESDFQSTQMVMHKDEVHQACNMNCDCDFVKYSPVCSEDGLTTFISACHAGCRDFIMEDGKKIFTDCSCIPSSTRSASLQMDIIDVSNQTVQDLLTENITTNLALPQFFGGRAFSGPCPVDCTTMFYSYIALVCLLKFTGSSGRTSNFLVSVRCVKEKDKATSLGFGMMLFSFFVFIPSPIIFGYIIDSTCVVWGKTCTRKGNCWLYEGESMRFIMNFTAAVFVLIGTMFDIGVWYFVKNLQIFDNEPKQDENKGTKEERELIEVQRADNGVLAKPISSSAADPAADSR